MSDRPTKPGAWFHLPTKTWWLVTARELPDALEMESVSGRVEWSDKLPPDLRGNWTPGIPQPGDEAIEFAACEVLQAVSRLEWEAGQAAQVEQDDGVYLGVMARGIESILRRAFQIGE